MACALICGMSIERERVGVSVVVAANALSRAVLSGVLCVATRSEERLREERRESQRVREVEKESNCSLRESHISSFISSHVRAASRGPGDVGDTLLSKLIRSAPSRCDMLQQPRRLAKSGARRGPLPQPSPDQRVFRPYAANARKAHFWSGKLPLLIGLAVLLLGYRIVRMYQYVQESKQQRVLRE